MKFSQFVLRGVFALSILLIGFSCAVNPVSGKKEISFMSESQELALGKQSDPSIVASFGLYEDQKLQDFINEKGKEMAAISHRPNLPYEFKILDSPVINAFAVPGGYVYFTRGILAHFNNEAEFAGVLGHEIGHVTARHSARAHSKQILGQAGFIIGVIALPGARELAEPASQALQLLFLKNSRDHESESDKLGVEYSTQVGYDAHHMANFFQTLKRKQVEAGVNIPTWQSTHPDPGDRFNRVHQLAEECQAEKGGSYKVNRESYLSMIDGLIYGEDPKGGYVEDDYFYHPVMKFKFPIPRGWQTQNSPTAFRMADKDGKGMMMLTLGEGNTPEAAAQAFNEKQQLRPSRGQRTQVNGMNAYVQVADQVQQQQGQQQQGQQAALKILSYFIEYNGAIYQMHGVTKPTDYASMERTFAYTMEGFNVLTDPSKINRQPDRIKIVKVTRSGTLSSVLQSYKMPQAKMDELSLINGMNLTDQVSNGTLIKLVEYDYLNRGSVLPSQSRTNTQPSTTRPTTTRPTTTSPTTTRPTTTRPTTTKPTTTQPSGNTNPGKTAPPPPRSSTKSSGTTKPGKLKKKNDN